LFQKNNKFQITTQFLFGEHMPPYYSVLNHTLMNKLIMHLKNPNAPTAKVFRVSILNYIIYFNMKPGNQQCFYYYFSNYAFHKQTFILLETCF